MDKKKLHEASMKASLRSDVPVDRTSFEIGAEWLENSQWTPVERELPQELGRYLCVYGGRVVDFGLLTKDGWYVKGVTHWMPVPQIPQGEQIPYSSDNGEGTTPCPFNQKNDKGCDCMVGSRGCVLGCEHFKGRTAEYIICGHKKQD